ncbi:DUF4334 domain-containing protein [Mesorhizobium sp. AaZ16]|uniref:DUF4334 domain-containing protein n=1 Tax=Mesorhizobium sp. AaZ16 TaxID=3402289 RepID=UPI00374E8A18
MAVSLAESPLSTDRGLLRFDDLASVDPDQMTGRWRGSGLHTRHPLDGLLEWLNWYGKSFESPEIVHPLLFLRRNGDILSIDLARLPLHWALCRPMLARSRAARKLFAVSRYLLRSSGATARLRKIEHRGVASAAIVYDRQPIIDYLRRIDDDRVVGLMDMRSMPQPFFFLLARDGFERAGCCCELSVGCPSGPDREAEVVEASVIPGGPDEHP